MVVKTDFDRFNDELVSMQELMDEHEIALRDKDLMVPISTLGLKKAVTVEPGTSIKQCVATLLARHFGCLLVVKNKKLKGIFTERDVLLKIAGEKVDLATAKVDDYMTPNPVTVTMNDPIIAALRLMHKGGYRHVTIVDNNGEPASVLSIRDIVHYIVEFFPQDVLNLPPHPIRVGSKSAEGG
ncbi:MAG TPA: CBS domain-containing protein [bacterium]